MFLQGVCKILIMATLTQDLIKINREKKRISFQGNWDLANINQLKKILKDLSWTDKTIILNGRRIQKMDSAGAWLLCRWLKKLIDNGVEFQSEQFSEEHTKLLALIHKQATKHVEIPRTQSPFWLTKWGSDMIALMQGITAFFSFIGLLTLEAIRVVFTPAHVRWRSFMNVIDKTGYQALPIIALLSFMIGVVITYQMGLQLRKFGANIFVVDLLGLAILREFGPLLTAIMVAGRSGSAFTAQLGIMKINQEIDALNTMGVTPIELLLLPRIAGLFIVLPLLTIWSDIFGIFGGMLMSQNMFDISWHDFLSRFQREIPLRSLIIGLGKAPVFALIIAATGCFQGMRVEGSAESVGRLTTRSVVLAIFFIIAADAIFSVIFSKFKL